MKIFKSLSKYKNLNSSVLTVGTFDGVHIGHQKVIKKLNKNKQDNQSVILTFFPHPRMVLQKGVALKLLNTLKEKQELLEKTDLDYLVIEPFTKEFSRLTALDFTRNILVNILKIKKLVIGYDHRFGRNREGDFEQLQEYGDLYNFEVNEISVQDIENIAVSSTKIRNALNQGNIEIANTFLGYEYMLTGKVVYGRGLGKKWNYPTINIQIDEDYKLIPKTGVYLIRTMVHRKPYFGIMNIGFRPTVDGKHQTIEVHLLDFNADLYGQNIQVNLIKRLRDEQKFSSVEILFNQINKDELLARQLIEQCL
ncbi:MAG: bifunctional riboflavin kinase/FAD synthetase [Flavobacteriaceae bacterium]|nr:bifunctional riboflavin kinase/FAD synthetase [Flavobacteriaceae bacterium]